MRARVRSGKLFGLGVLLLLTCLSPALRADTVTGSCIMVDIDGMGGNNDVRCNFVLTAEGGATSDFHINIGETADQPTAVNNSVNFTGGPDAGWCTSVSKPRRCQGTDVDCSANGDADCGGGVGSCLARWCEGGTGDKLGCLNDPQCGGGTCVGGYISLNWATTTCGVGVDGTRSPISDGNTGNFDVEMTNRGTSGNPTSIGSNDGNDNQLSGRKNTNDANGLDAFSTTSGPVLLEAAGACILENSCLNNATREACRALDGAFDLGSDCPGSRDDSFNTVPVPLPKWAMAALVLALMGAGFFILRRTL